MNFLLPMLAQETVPGMNDDAKTQMLYVGIFSALILCLVIWAAFIRKSKQKRKRINRPHNWETEPGADKSQHKRSRRERRRRSPGHSSHLPTNPTLASKGGLPPRRSDNVPPNGD